MKTSDRELLKGYYWNHDAIRKDVQRLENISNKVEELEEKDFARINKWFHFHKFALIEHHRGEDTFFFPKIAERTAEFSDDLKQFDEEHKALDKQLDTVEGLFAEYAVDTTDSVDRTEITEAIAEYNRMAIEHLDKEEAVVDKAVSDHFSKEEVLQAEEEFRNSIPKEKMAKLMPWMVDAMDEKDRHFFFSQLSFVPKLLYRLSLRGKYNHLVKHI